MVQRAFILADREIDASALPVPVPDGASTSPSDGPRLEVEIGVSVDEVERRLILATLDASDGNKERAASTLGISLKTLYNKLNKYKATT